MLASSGWLEMNATTTVSALQQYNITSYSNNDSYYGAPPVFPPYIRTTATVICSLIMGIGVLGNIMVPIVIFKSKDMRNSTNVFLMNLSLADLMERKCVSTFGFALLTLTQNLFDSVGPYLGASSYCDDHRKDLS
ncbi:hypothetical protein RUM44_002251 [Polyplax serrata]|uniref:G-protein coupled receptors family 1 profile domain-containing protein n=1 Tax=Polyplax serrata TaxID=468196 RepID=A0ABR1AMC6_POLSC